MTRKGLWISHGKHTEKLLKSAKRKCNQHILSDWVWPLTFLFCMMRFSTSWESLLSGKESIWWSHCWTWCIQWRVIQRWHANSAATGRQLDMVEIGYPRRQSWSRRRRGKITGLLTLSASFWNLHSGPFVICAVPQIAFCLWFMTGLCYLYMNFPCDFLCWILRE